MEKEIEKEIKLKINQKHLHLILWIVVIILAIVFFFYLSKKFSWFEKYALVYTTDGNIYVGKISSFPRLKLTKVFVLNTNDQNQKVLVPLSNLFDFQTKDFLYLNKKNIIWILPLKNESNIISNIKNYNQQTNLSNLPMPQPTNPQNIVPNQQGQPNLLNPPQNQSRNIQQNPPVVEEEQ